MRGCQSCIPRNTCPRNGNENASEQAEQERSARQVTELRKLEKRQKRAERQLLSAWQRVERLRSTLGTVS